LKIKEGNVIRLDLGKRQKYSVIFVLMNEKKREKEVGPTT